MTAPLTIPEPTPLDQLLSLDGKVAIVTGGSRGLGEAIVRRLAEAGATVVFTGRTLSTLQPLADEITASGGAAVAREADAADLDSTRRVVEQAVQRYGRLDILVNNAAVFQNRVFLDTTEELWDQEQAVDLKGAFFAAQIAAEAMITAGNGGRIINILSTDAFRPTGIFAAYSTIKAGLAMATVNMAKELAEHGILVNSVTPGSTITQERIDAIASGDFAGDVLPKDAVRTREKMQSMMPADGPAAMLQRLPLGRPGFPVEIADSVLFFCSAMAGYVTGQNIIIDGAQTLSR
ncbi:SDR family NAD(P)-dependent oxidoreductase [Brachybacterium sp. Marseille-Q2903]|uniref:SDR family NAD(P)-dependent oxidoreductase n=1 Tax=Brachybacterium epidermidis TaxID=2781983 RepID=A0ABR9W3L3_9MICO|nr:MULTISPECIES: SDR family NAD(P)-dependent oxidoreductase [Brachybacterium]MBE9404997.1 SDR family NAD(P)-dependent oxidoreductase [Brachybacterium epidermidis]MCT1776828.1 SDR family NAD(P)-dependent oxidoreductase [Brachybacterium sp. p3-SID957]